METTIVFAIWLLDKLFLLEALAQDDCSGSGFMHALPCVGAGIKQPPYSQWHQNLESNHNASDEIMSLFLSRFTRGVTAPAASGDVPQRAGDWKRGDSSP